MVQITVDRRGFTGFSYTLWGMQARDYEDNLPAKKPPKEKRNFLLVSLHSVEEGCMHQGIAQPNAGYQLNGIIEYVLFDLFEGSHAGYSLITPARLPAEALSFQPATDRACEKHGRYRDRRRCHQRQNRRPALRQFLVPR